MFKMSKEELENVGNAYAGIVKNSQFDLKKELNLDGIVVNRFEKIEEFAQELSLASQGGRMPKIMRNEPGSAQEAALVGKELAALLDRFYQLEKSNQFLRRLFVKILNRVELKK